MNQPHPAKTNRYGDQYVTNPIGQIQEFQYHDGQTFKFKYDASGNVCEVVTGIRDGYIRQPDGMWTTRRYERPTGSGRRRYDFGEITIDQNGLHASGPDAKQFKKPPRLTEVEERWFKKFFEKG